MKSNISLIKSACSIALALTIAACSGGENSSTSTLGGFAGNMRSIGSVDGTGALANFRYPWGVATDNAGNVYVADSRNHNIRKITPAGVVTTLAGTAGVIGSADGTGTEAKFSYPSSAATDSAGNVYVADQGNNTIRKITPSGAVSTVVGVPGKAGFISGVLPGGLAGMSGLAISGTSLYITTENGVAVVSNVPWREVAFHCRTI